MWSSFNAAAVVVLFGQRQSGANSATMSHKMFPPVYVAVTTELCCIASKIPRHNNNVVVVVVVLDMLLVLHRRFSVLTPSQRLQHSLNIKHHHYKRTSSVEYICIYVNIFKPATSRSLVTTATDRPTEAERT